MSASHKLAQYPIAFHFRNLINSGNVYLFVVPFRSHDTVVNTTRLRAGSLWVRNRANEIVFLFNETSRPVLGSIQLTARWIAGLFPRVRGGAAME